VNFGDPSDFAIEAIVEPDLIPPSAVWGRMCVWCRGCALGDLSETHCALYPAFTAFQALPDWLEDRWENRFEGLSGKELYELLEGASWANVADAGMPVPIEWENRLHRTVNPWKFRFLCNWGEQFDGASAFLVCGPNENPLILSKRFTESSSFVEVSREGLLKASREFVKWFEEQQRHLSRMEV
jgi:hypothetical protein